MSKPGGQVMKRAQRARRGTLIGYGWALASVLLVSGAQLALKQAMGGLPPLWDWLAFLLALWHGQAAVFWLVGGLLGYGVSMLCWYLALRRLALSKAYSLLSLSYVLVWLAAGALPGWHEAYSWRGFAGLLAVIVGVLLVVSGSKRR